MENKIYIVWGKYTKADSCGLSNAFTSKKAAENYIQFMKTKYCEFEYEIEVQENMTRFWENN